MRNIKTNNSTQTQILLDHFRNTGSISGLEAMALYRVTSLTKVISVLNAKGYEIVKLWKRDNTGKRYARYFSTSTIPNQFIAVPARELGSMSAVNALIN